MGKEVKKIPPVGVCISDGEQGRVGDGGMVDWQP